MRAQAVIYIYGRNKFTGKTQKKWMVTDLAEIERIQKLCRKEGLYPHLHLRSRTRTYSQRSPD
jgi:hypothetical protein